MVSTILDTILHKQSVDCDIFKAKSLDHKGIFSRPSDSLAEYLSLFPKEERSFSPVSKSIYETCIQYLDVDIRYITVCYDPKKLFLWEAACCIIDEKDIPIIYTKDTSYLSSEMILFHEYIHAMRARLDSSIFEEIIAFDCTRYFYPKELSKIRAIASSLFTNAYEVILLGFFSILVSLLPIIFNQMIPLKTIYSLIFLVWAIPIVRLWRRIKIYSRTKKMLQTILPENFWKLLIRLSDEEIYAFSRQKLPSPSWRWKMLSLLFQKV